MLHRLATRIAYRATVTSDAPVPILKQFGIVNPTIHSNLSVPEYYERGVGYIPTDPGTIKNSLSSTGAFVAYSGAKTGRVPSAKSIVNDPLRQRQIAWGDVNKRMPATSYQILEDLAINFFNTRKDLYVVDGYAGWDPEDRITVRVVCTRAYHALFMHNMLIRPTKKQLQQDFSQGANYYIFNAGQFHSVTNIPGVVGKQAVSINFQKRRMVILGTQYAGQMKKGVFSIMNYLMPKKHHLPLHSSCNIGPNNDPCLFFGLSGTGKTALSTVPERKLIGDDEHVWTDNGLFNIEGGCYAKCINLSPEKQPDIFNAIRFGSVLENVVLRKRTRQVNFFDTQYTENTRVSYPLEFISNSQIPAITGHPKNIIFLTCDAFSVLPPVSKLTHEQALYHFYSGYTSKVAGTEMGIKQPVPAFSACFGQAFLPLKPQVYADLLSQKIKKHNVNVWLVNTGWIGGRYGVGKRISIQNTRKIIDAIYDGSLEQTETEIMPIFNLPIPKAINGVPSEILNPRNSWKNKEQYDQYLNKAANMFKENFQRFEQDASQQVKAGGPSV